MFIPLRWFWWSGFHYSVVFFFEFVPLMNWGDNPNLDSILFYIGLKQASPLFLNLFVDSKKCWWSKFWHHIRGGEIIVFPRGWVLYTLFFQMFPRHEGNLSFVAGSPAPWIQHWWECLDPWFLRLKPCKTRPPCSNEKKGVMWITGITFMCIYIFTTYTYIYILYIRCIMYISLWTLTIWNKVVYK